MSKKRVEIETKAGGLGALPWNHWIPETFMFPKSWNFLRGRHVVLEKEIRQLKRVIFTGHNTNIYYFHNWINKPSAKEMHYPRTLSEATKVARSGKYRQSKTVLSFKVIRMKAVWLKSLLKHENRSREILKFLPKIFTVHLWWMKMQQHHILCLIPFIFFLNLRKDCKIICSTVA